MLMYDLPIQTNAQRILELGIGSEAFSSYVFLKALEQTGGTLTSVEIKHEFVEKFKGNPKWNIIEADDRIWKPVETYDVLMLDTSHQDIHTLIELYKFIPHLKDGGYLFIHDTELPSVQMAINEFIKDQPNILTHRYEEPHIPRMSIYEKLTTVTLHSLG